MSFYKDINEHVAQAQRSFYAPSLDATVAHVKEVQMHWLEHTRKGRATDPITASNLTLATVLVELATSPPEAPPVTVASSNESVEVSNDYEAPSLDSILDHVQEVHQHWLEHTRNGMATDPITASSLTLATVLLELATSPTVLMK